MTGSYFDFFNALTNSSVGNYMRVEEFAFPTVEAFHLLGSVVVVTAISILGLRLTGRFLREKPVSQIARQFVPWAWYGFALQVVTGALLFISEASRAYNNVWFILKMSLILLMGLIALVFHRTIYRKVKTWDLSDPPFSAKFLGYASIIIWLAVVAVGRWLNTSIANTPLPRP